MKKPTLNQWVASAFAAVCLATVTPLQAQSKGELLYSTHCIACHGDQMHWRDKKLANDWISLKGQVQRWQGVAMLRWSDEDIVSVAQYLNERYYRFPKTADQVSLAQPFASPWLKPTPTAGQ